MKKFFAILIFIVSFWVNGYSANMPAWAWNHTFNANLNVIEYHDNYLYTAGTFSSWSFIFGNANIANHGFSDIVIMKWDTLGNMIWATSIWGSNYDSAASIKVNSAGELIVAGHTNSATINIAGNVLTSHGGSDIFIAKYDLNGNYINANTIGTAGNEYAADMCTDYQNNIYVASYDKVTKYNSSLAFIWYQSLPAQKLDYSQFDSTIVVTGYFINTLTVGNDTITAAYTQQWGVLPDLFAAKFSLGNTPLWLTNVTNYYKGDYGLYTYIHEQTGAIFIGSSYTNVAVQEVFKIREVSAAGQVSYTGITFSSYDEHCFSMAGKDSLISFCLHEQGGFTNYIYNIFTDQLIRKYSQIGAGSVASFQCFRGLQSIYTLNDNTVDFGKVEGFSLTGTPTNQTITKCIGSSAVLIGNISGGDGPLTYSWAPAIGLNNTNTDTVSFTATNNISYTLTVTDTAGHIAKDTFNIIVDTPIIPQTITAQFPAFCSDSMHLYSNMGSPVTWKIYWQQQNYWQNINPASVDRTIYFPTKYSYQVSNACGTVSDTIEILPAFNVSAFVTADTICAGQSTVLYGGGAVSYIWSGNVLNNIPFSPLITQNYTVTGTDANGCKDTSTISVIVNLRPFVNNLTSAPSFICAQGNAILSIDTTVGLNTITWAPATFLDTTAGNNVSVNNINSTTTYTITITDIKGCSNSDSVTITVYPLPNVNITPDADTTICFGTNYILNADSGFIVYKWIYNANIISGLTLVSVISDGNYVLSCTDGNGCSASDSVQIEILPAPHPELTYENYYLKCSNVQNVSYQWYLNDVPFGGNDSIVYVAKKGNYKIIVYDNTGCAGIDSLKIDFDIIAIDSNGVSLYPNPSTGIVSIDYFLSDASDVSITLYDINGRVVHSFLENDLQQTGFHRLFFNLDKLGIETGVYFFRIQLGIESYIKKLIFH